MAVDIDSLRIEIKALSGGADLKNRGPRCFGDRSPGGVGGIRTLGPLLTATRFPVVLVMTTSILLHTGAVS